MTKIFKLSSGVNHTTKDNIVNCHELPNGEIYESRVLCTKVKLTTCDCIIIYKNSDQQLARFVSKCKLHKSLDDTQLSMNTILTHHKKFSLKFGHEPTESEHQQTKKNMAVEKKRIKNLS